MYLYIQQELFKKKQFPYSNKACTNKGFSLLSFRNKPTEVTQTATSSYLLYIVIDIFT